MKQATTPLSVLMATKAGSVDPSLFPNEVFDLYSIPAFDAGVPDVVAGSEIGSAKQIVRPGDVLLSKIVPHIRRAWVVCDDRGRRIIGSGEWIVFRGSKFHAPYLRHVLVSDVFHANFMATVSGVGGSLLRARPAYVANIEIPLPPLAEQRRIADILDRADAVRADRRAALALLDTLPQALFLDLFGDPVTNPKGWSISTVAAVAEVQSGLQVTTARIGNPREVPYLRVANVYRGRLALDEIKSIRVTDAEFLRARLRKDDLLLVEGHGNPDEIGRCALWDGSVPECVHQNHIIRARFDLSRLHPCFVAEYINSPGGRRHLLRAGRTTTGLNTISVSDVRDTPVALPPLPLQQEFARRVGKVEQLRLSHRESLGRLDELFAGLQYRAFAGEL